MSFHVLEVCVDIREDFVLRADAALDARVPGRSGSRRAREMLTSADFKCSLNFFNALYRFHQLGIRNAVTLLVLIFGRHVVQGHGAILAAGGVFTRMRGEELRVLKQL